MIYGYARCSTLESRNLQDIDRQKRELKALGCKEENIYFEYESGTKVNRVELNRLLEIIQEGDVLVATEVSRISRSTKQLWDILEIVEKKKLRLILGSLDIDYSNRLNPIVEATIKLMAVFAELEKNILSERVRSGLENAKAKGKTLGRPVTTHENLPQVFLKYYPMYLKRKINKSELAKLCNLSRQSVYKYLEVYENSKG